MSTTTMFSFWAFSLMFVITPGVDWAYVITAGIRGRYIPAVLGLVSGYMLLTIIVAAGISPLLVGHSTLMMLLALIGSLYLIWLGFNMLRQPPAALRPEEYQVGGSWLLAATKGVLVSGLNPKAFMFFLAFLPPFTVAGATWTLPTQLFVLGIIYTLSTLVVYMLVGYGANRVLRSRPEATQVVSRLSGSIMLLLGLVLLYRQFP